MTIAAEFFLWKNLKFWTLVYCTNCRIQEDRADSVDTEEILRKLRETMDKGRVCHRQLSPDAGKEKKTMI